MVHIHIYYLFSTNLLMMNVLHIFQWNYICFHGCFNLTKKKKNYDVCVFVYQYEFMCIQINDLVFLRFFFILLRRKKLNKFKKQRVSFVLVKIKRTETKQQIWIILTNWLWRAIKHCLLYSKEMGTSITFPIFTNLM